ncbi:MAG: Fic family protein [Fibrobacterota bacterium]|nr:Fic family protein [Fibrobacterota bacterium]
MLEKKLDFPFNDNQKVLQTVASIDRFHGKWQLKTAKAGETLRELRRMATVQSIGSSTRIEGSLLSDKEVSKLLDDVRITKFESRDQEEVVGYYNALETLLENHKSIQIRESTVLNLHGILLKPVGKDERHRGEYKSLSNRVNARYADGKTKIIFETTPPHLVRKEMEDLLSWTQTRIKKTDIHPLLVVGLFVYEFLSIHPFQDGNGRLSRLLTTLLLLKFGYGFIQYISFEHQIENRKSEYYRALMTCQKRRKPGKAEDISEWIHFFLGCLLELAVKLEKKSDGLKGSGGYLNKRQLGVLDFIKQSAPVKLSDLTSRFPGLSVNTLKKDVQYLVQEGRLEKTGQKKGSVYSPGDAA